MTLDLNTVRFGRGLHRKRTEITGDRDMCIMEAVALFAGEPWSDYPACASPVISAFLRSWQDELSDEERDRLLPASVWVPRLIGSAKTIGVERQRGYMLADWLARIYTQAWLNTDPRYADLGRTLPKVTDGHTWDEAIAVLSKAYPQVTEAPPIHPLFLPVSARQGIWSVWGRTGVKAVKSTLNRYEYLGPSPHTLNVPTDLQVPFMAAALVPAPPTPEMPLPLPVIPDQLLRPLQDSVLDLLDRLLNVQD